MRPTEQQKGFARDSVTNAIRQICESWDTAREDEQARGYQVRTGDAATRTKGHVANPVASAATNEDKATEWMRRCNRSLSRLLSMSSFESKRRWTGAFYPPSLLATFERAVGDVVDIWPLKIEFLFDELEHLGSEGVTYWPATPKPGTVIGEVRVGEKLNEVVMCTECSGPVVGGAGDPIARIDGRPYHRKPCYQTVWQRNARRMSKESA